MYSIILSLTIYFRFWSSFESLFAITCSLNTLFCKSFDTLLAYEKALINIYIKSSSDMVINNLTFLFFKIYVRPSLKRRFFFQSFLHKLV